MADIADVKDIRRLVDTFYGRVRRDSVLAPLFNDVACVDWHTHLDVMTTFWSALLLRSGRYRRNALAPHLRLFGQVAYQPSHMQRWLTLFDQSVDELFQGSLAEKSKHWARGIARNMENQIIKATASQEVCND
ncbi:group III truncated hemoglobin [Kistimonas asteriae]|uniref:group III truncated hemoglobin n=1 Tax=Kistimonas asteriae TaxID=517724 RepID=UPI001BA9BCE0|nr:group III truncated hemoglobin [Kistimonas asteriae]